MFGLICCHDPKEPPYREIERVRFRAVSVTVGETLRARLSCRAAARTLTREGVREAVFPTEPVFREAFAKFGIVPVSSVPLYRATAAAIVRRYMMRRGIDSHRATVLFAAEEVTTEFRRMVESLSADVRYIALRVPDDGRLAAALQRQRGVAAQRSGQNTPGLTVAFGAVEAEGTVLRFDDTLRVSYDSAYPNALLTALWRAGALDADMLCVTSVETE